jgi:hypothetical protein
MAIVILFGLLSSTALNMLVVPALYLRFGAAWRRDPGADAEQPRTAAAPQAARSP